MGSLRFSKLNLKSLQDIFKCKTNENQSCRQPGPQIFPLPPLSMPSSRNTLEGKIQSIANYFLEKLAVQ